MNGIYCPVLQIQYVNNDFNSLHHVPRGDPQAKLPAPKSTELKYLSKKKLKLFYRAFSHDSDMSCNAQQVLERIDWCRQQLLDVYDLDLRICPRVEAMIQFWAPYDESKMLRGTLKY